MLHKTKTLPVQSTSWIFAIFTILSLWPFISWKWPIIPVSFIVIAYCVFAYEIVVINKLTVSIFGLTSFLFILVFLLIFYFLPGGIPPWSNYYSFFSLLLLLLPSHKCLDISVKFKKIFVITLIPGLIVYFLLLFGVKIPYADLSSHNEVKELLGVSYRDYGVTIALSHLTYEIGSITLIRFSGIYDEPGLLGTIASLLLLADKFDMRKKENIILLTAGIASVSLVFYLFAIVGFICQSRRKILNLTVLFVIAASLFNTPIYDNYLGKRFNDNSSGSIVKDNRVSECFEKEYDIFIASGVKTQLLGEGHNAHLATLCDVSSYKMYIYDYGFLGILILLSLISLQYFNPVISMGVLKGYSKWSSVFLILFLVSYYQRPVMFNLAFCMVFYYSIYVYADKNR